VMTQLSGVSSPFSLLGCSFMSPRSFRVFLKAARWFFLSLSPNP
jgi:hypothetical protein